MGWSVGVNQKFSVGMSLSALSTGCPGENHIYVSSARTAAVLACIKILQGATMEAMDGFAALKFLITLKRNKKFSRQETISWLRVSPGQNKMLESYNLSLLVFIVVVGRPLHLGWAVGLDLMVQIQKRNNWQEMSTEQVSTSFRRRHCFVSFMCWNLSREFVPKAIAIIWMMTK